MSATLPTILRQELEEAIGIVTHIEAWVRCTSDSNDIAFG